MSSSGMFPKLRRHWRSLVVLTAIEGVGGYVAYRWWQERRRQEALTATSAQKHAMLQWTPPSRAALLGRLQHDHSQPEKPLDILIIGGGATGTGCAVEAALRGLSVACVEQEDWSSGTSSKSTKLVHGGVRYLEKAIKEFDWEQYKLVDEALRERSTVLQIAPHLTDQLPIMLPIYKWYLIPYFWIGSKTYDLVAGSAGLQGSYFLPRAKALKIFPMLKREGLAGAMVYYDGVQNDSRMNVTLALTALHHGALVTNYTRVCELIKDEEDSQIKGAVLEDCLTGKKWPVYARVVINATGPFCDAIRKMDDPTCPEMVKPSAGTHIVLPNYYSPRNMGLIDPSTSDGRVLFFLPWEGNVISGTTDAPCAVSTNPKAGEGEINFILEQINRYLSPDIKVRRNDVLAAWTGIRPLIRDPSKMETNPNPAASSTKGTEALVRNHLIITSDAGLITIAGGKWTTYRAMAEETIDWAMRQAHLKADVGSSTGDRHASSDRNLLIGAHGFTDTTYLKLIQRYGLETETAQHLARSYGDRAILVADLMKDTGLRWPLHGRRLHHLYPYDEAEVRYACKQEHAQTAVDVLARRTRLAFLSVQAAREALPRVVEIMAEELRWTAKEKSRQIQETEKFLESMGSREVYPSRAAFSAAQINTLRTQFHKHDTAFSGKIEGRRAAELLRGNGLIDTVKIEQILKRVDADNCGYLGFSDYLEAVALAGAKIEETADK